MNRVLWILQVILSIKSVSAAFSHVVRHDKAEMAWGIERMGSVARPVLIGAAFLMLLGALGLVAPAIAPGPPWMAPLAAALLAVLMLGSIAFHLTCRETPRVFVGLVLFLMAAFVAYGRWAVWSL